MKITNISGIGICENMYRNNSCLLLEKDNNELSKFYTSYFSYFEIIALLFKVPRPNTESTEKLQTK